MAYKFLLCTVLVATIAAAYADDDEDDDVFGFGPTKMKFPEIPTPPPLPNFPGMLKFPTLPKPPSFGTFKTLPQFPNMIMPDFTFPSVGPGVEFPTPEEIVSHTPSPGGSFNGVLIASKSVGKRDENDKVHWNGGSTVMLNDNGEVTVEKMGDSPPDVVVPKVPPFPGFPEKFEFPGKHFKPIKPFMPFKPFKHNFKKFDPEAMKNYVPRKGENFVSTSSSSSSFSHDVNGMKTSGGSASVMKNLNGEVEEKKAAFLKSDPPAE